MSIPLPINIVVGQTGHAGLHNDVNAAVNAILDVGVTTPMPIQGTTLKLTNAQSDANGFLYLGGVSVAASAVLTAGGTLDIGSGNSASLRASTTFVISADDSTHFATGNNQGVSFDTQGHNYTTALGFVGASSPIVVKGSGGSVTAAIGFKATVNNIGAITLNTGYGFYVANGSNSGGGVYQNQEGLHIESLTRGSVSNKAIVTGSGLIVLGDQVTITGSADRIQLVVKGNGTQTTSLAEFQTSAAAVMFAFSNAGKLTVPTTITAPGTTGNQTINKLAGRVNIAAGGTTITVTNSLVTTSSIIFATIATNDATARIANVVPGSGSFVINIVACTAEVAINWMVLA